MFEKLINDFKLKANIFLGRRIHPFTHFPKSLNIQSFLDIGANKGEYASAYFHCFPTGKAWLVEPIPKLHDVINTRLRDYDQQYKLFGVCLGDRAGEININVANQIGASSVLPLNDAFANVNPNIKITEVVRAKLMTLDDFSLEESLPTMDLMKIDVEGFEYEIIRGGVSYIRSKVNWILVEHSFVRSDDSQQRFLNVHAKLLELGFDLYGVRDQYHAEGTGQIIQFDAIYRKQNWQMQSGEGVGL